MHFDDMMPRLGAKYDVDVQVISKPRAEYKTDTYTQLGLPAAPAIMVGDEVLVQGADLSEEKLESVICSRLGLPVPEPQKKGFFDRLRGK